jgi:threonylcarbamoyladenosine tRNA methylthiotransferase MtaB
VDEARRLGESGVREIVVTGICVGAYNEQTGSGGPDLAGLLLAVADQPGVARVRLSSIQPIEVTDDLINAFASHPNLCPHLHLSCQSGDDAVLARMNRPYDAAFFVDLVRRLRARVPDLAITTDLIVGYPGETRDEHENTLRFAQTVAFQKTHVFRYSPRPAHPRRNPARRRARRGKKAPPRRTASRGGRHPPRLHRTSRRRNSARPRRKAARARPGMVSGHTMNYIVVRFAGPRALRGQIVPVRLTGVSPNGDATGELALSPTQLAARLEAAPAPPTDFLPLAMASTAER